MSNWWKGVIWDNCVKIPKLDNSIDFSKMDKNTIFTTIKADRKLLGQLKYQNPKAFAHFSSIFNIAEDYGC
jgi:ribosomal protein L20